MIVNKLIEGLADPGQLAMPTDIRLVLPADTQFCRPIAATLTVENTLDKSYIVDLGGCATTESNECEFTPENIEQAVDWFIDNLYTTVLQMANELIIDVKVENSAWKQLTSLLVPPLAGLTNNPGTTAGNSPIGNDCSWIE